MVIHYDMNLISISSDLLECQLYNLCMLIKSKFIYPGSTSPDVIIVDEEPARRTHTLPSSTPINKLRNSQPHGVRQGQSAVRSPAPIPTNLLRPAGGHNPVTVRHAGVMRQPLVIQPAPNINVSDFNRQNIRFAGNTVSTVNTF